VSLSDAECPPSCRYRDRVPRLIHLNGPPAIGKSTIGELYAADHPGTLLLDIDRVRTMVGGWRDDFADVGEIVRPVAIAMARAHLVGGHDVLMPQYLGAQPEIEAWEHVTASAGAEFVEVILMDDVERSVQRFTDRGSGVGSPLLSVIQSTVDASGGRDHLRILHRELSHAVASRDRSMVVQSRQGDLEGTYREVLTALAVR
jgi:hypothetical protein